jgi:hypothetical protein
MKEIDCEIAGKTFEDGSNITIAFKTYSDVMDRLAYKVIIVKDSAIIEDIPFIYSKNKAVRFFEKSKEFYLK